MEGTHCYRPEQRLQQRRARSCRSPSTAHGGGKCAVTGGYVYRGSAIPDLQGWYVYGDYCTGEIWALDPTDPATGRRDPDRWARARAGW